MDKKSEAIFEIWEDLKKNRTTWEPVWQDVSDHLIPGDVDMYQDLKLAKDQTKTTPETYDSTGPDALMQAAAGLYSRATNPASKWFYLEAEMGDETSKEDKEWLDNARDKVQEVTNRTLSSPMHQGYVNALAYGTAITYVDQNNAGQIYGRTLDISNAWIAEGRDGFVDTVYRKFVYTASRAYLEYGDKLHADTVKLAREKPNDLVTFLHATFPREIGDVDPKLRQGHKMPIASFVVEEDKQHIVRETGYMTMPYATIRPEQIPGDVYGRGPGLTALPDVKTLNALKKVMLDAAYMMIRPALDVPVDAYISPISLVPGGLNFNQDAQGRKITPIHSTDNVQFTFNHIEEIKASIRKIFFNDRLQLITGPAMTAFEVQERTKQQLALMGPWLAVLERPYLEVIISRVFQLLGDSGQLGVVPDAFRSTEDGGLGFGANIKYNSPLARAQKQTDIEVIDETLQLVGNAAQLDPGVLDIFNMDRMITDRSLARGLKEKYIKSDQEVAATRQAKQQQMQQQQLMGGAKDMAQAAKTMAEIPGSDALVQEAIGG